jgi:hypothetical protein
VFRAFNITVDSFEFTRNDGVIRVEQYKASRIASCDIPVYISGSPTHLHTSSICCALGATLNNPPRKMSAYRRAAPSTSALSCCHGIVWSHSRCSRCRVAHMIAKFNFAATSASRRISVRILHDAMQPLNADGSCTIRTRSSTAARLKPRLGGPLV